MLKRLNFWMPVAAIAAVTLPWHFATLHLMLPTFTAEAGWRFTSRALLFYSRATVASVGMGVAGLAVIGVWDRVITPALKAEVEPGWVALGALPVSVILFHSLVSGGLEKRYLITAIPPILLFCTAGAAAVGNWFAAFLGKPRYMQQIVMASVALLFCLTTLSFPAKGSYGFQGAAEQILSDEGSRGAILVSSETNYGEGILVSEIAMRDRGMKHIVLRASKVLAQNSWNQSLDEDYRPVFGDSTTMQNCLQDAQVRALVIDTTPGPKKYTHHRQLLEAVARHQDEWTLVGSSGSVLLYRSAIPIPFGGDPMRRIRTNLDGGLKSWPIVERFACPGQEVTPTVASK